MEPKLAFVLLGEGDDRFTFAYVSTIELGRMLWTRIAGHTGGMLTVNNLVGFELADGESVVYAGDYVTDEC